MIARLMNLVAPDANRVGPYIFFVPQLLVACALLILYDLILWVVDKHLLSHLDWHEGFSDYRTQSQSAGALVELVTFSYHLNGKGSLRIERDGAAVERFRTTLFDFGLPFTCKEFKNERRYVERAEFDISCDVSVSARWRADFAKGAIVLEARNLERLGSALYTLRPRAIDQALLDDFGRLVLGQPNRFRELAKR